MRVAWSEEEFRRSFNTARGEAIATFGSGELYIEKYLIGPRHVEVQILADLHGNVVYLGERDCSLQRRHQKLIEESPSPAVDDDLRARMGEVAVKASHAANYHSAGTVEFLLDESGGFYFMEMNTRIQVEHPVTEMVTGLDLVKEQIRIAAGEPLSIRQEDLVLRGHAIECRINAEDPTRDFAPAPGVVEFFHAPGGPGVRVDSHVYAGYKIPPFYDSMIAKLICHGVDRQEAIARMRRALNEMIIEGLPSTLPFHLSMMDHPRFLAGNVNTRFLDEEDWQIAAEK